MRTLVILAFLFPFCAAAQSLRAIDELSRRHQQCLDKGEHMQACSKLYYRQMDSMLNLSYNNLCGKLTGKEREMLVQEQRLWLQGRDIYFADQVKTFQKNLKSGKWGPDMFMVVYSNDAEYVKKRVTALIRKMRS